MSEVENKRESKSEFIMRRWKEENLVERVKNLAKLAAKKKHYQEAIGLLENLNQMDIKDKKDIIQLLLEFEKESKKIGENKEEIEK